MGTYLSKDDKVITRVDNDVRYKMRSLLELKQTLLVDLGFKK